MVDIYAQQSLVETVYSCSRTLLDTFNHLLDYAQINTLTRPVDRKQNGAAKSRPEGAAPGSRKEVVQGLLAGAQYKRNGPDGDNAGATSGSESRLMTIVDIEWKDSWLFSIVELSVKPAGFVYDSAENGLAAVEKFKKNRYNALIMDISMPVMDGVTATREMRQSEETRKLPPATIETFTAALSVNLFLTKTTPWKRLKEILRQPAEGQQVSQD
ncbi:hypothetical protein BJY01DRAFT_247651 [Aspergillus pseudoustus]|uniref:Response regulatory domain-containing protein n=1 Tax=Aspergillus pseudoustus TaxID=1810923 RepID=A0ABR4JZJ8_9EURO